MARMQARFSRGRAFLCLAALAAIAPARVRAAEPEESKARAERAFSSLPVSPAALSDRGVPAVPRAVEVGQSRGGRANGAEQEGPAAALAFEESYGHDAIPLAGLKNIVPLTPSMWTPRQVVDDFNKNKRSGQVAALVMVKSEMCHDNEFRNCAVATAALEKFATPLLKRFRVYGVRIHPDNDGAPLTPWEKGIIATYHWQQGPGANLIVIFPTLGRSISRDAHTLGLRLPEFKPNGGQVPKLEKFLEYAIDVAEGRKLLPPPRP